MITIKNKNGMEITADTLGATITDLVVNGVHVANNGITIGRYANRISNAAFSLDGKLYSLPANEGVNTLHGGTMGFAKKLWEGKKLSENSAEFSIFSEDMDQGFPGNMNLKVSFTLSEDNQLVLRYRATCDKPTVINIVNHAYFNLNGCGPLSDHRLWINADNYLEFDEGLIPTGKFLSVKGTKFDFSHSKRYTDNFDDCFLICGAGMRHAATLMGDKSRICMDVITDQPAMQLYNTKDRICLETEALPDSPNRPEFPSVRLDPGEVYETTTAYAFSY